MRQISALWRESFAVFSAKLSPTRLLTHELGYDLAGVDPQHPC
jgi:hypothetical protein